MPDMKTVMADRNDPHLIYMRGVSQASVEAGICIGLHPASAMVVLLENLIEQTSQLSVKSTIEILESLKVRLENFDKPADGTDIKDAIGDLVSKYEAQTSAGQA